MSYRSRTSLYRMLVARSQASNFSSSCNLVNTIHSRRISNSSMIPNSEFSSATTANNLHFPFPIWSNSQFATLLCSRKYSGGSGSSEPDFDEVRAVDRINLKFAEAREEIEAALESKETVYFDEEAECARNAVKEVLEMFEGLLSKLSESERKALQRSMGLKMEQLKAELKQLDE